MLDNLGAHHAEGVREVIEAAGARVLYTPPCSPDLNPIALCWSKVKQALRAAGARAEATLAEAVQRVATLVTPSDIAGWFRHCGCARRN